MYLAFFSSALSPLASIWNNSDALAFESCTKAARMASSKTLIMPGIISTEAHLRVQFLLPRCTQYI